MVLFNCNATVSVHKAAAATAAGAAAPAVVVAAVNALGFTSAGVTAGSSAAAWMATGGGITPILVGVGQAIGATGSVVAGAGALTAVGVVGIGAAATYAVLPESAILAAERGAMSATRAAWRGTAYAAKGTAAAGKRAWEKDTIAGIAGAARSAPGRAVAWATRPWLRSWVPPLHFCACAAGSASGCGAPHWWKGSVLRPFFRCQRI